MTTIQTSDGSVYQKPNSLKTSVAVGAGSFVAGAVQTVQTPLFRRVIPTMNKLNENVDKEELRKAIYKALNSQDNGVKLVDFSGRTVSKNIFAKQELKEIIDNIIDNINECKKPKEKIKLSFKLVKKVMNKAILTELINGKNAAFHPIKNKVLINIDKIGTSAFHEIGHSINYNNSKFWKLMQKSRLPMMILSPVFMSVGLIKRKKAEGEQPKNIFDKATDFIKNNAGKLSALAFVPIIAEEAMASFRGCKMAKQLCSPELFKKVLKTNALGGLTYVALAVLTGIGTYAGVKLRDAIAKPKEIKKA